MIEGAAGGMEGELNLITKDLLQRIMRAVAVVEADYVTRAVGPRRPPVHQGANVQFLRVTGAATTQDLIDYYPARVRQFNPESGTTADLADEDDFFEVKIMDWMGDELDVSGDTDYPAKMIGRVDIGDTNYALFARLGPGSAAPPSTCVRVLTDWACADGEVTKTWTYLRGVNASSTPCP